MQTIYAARAASLPRGSIRIGTPINDWTDNRYISNRSQRTDVYSSQQDWFEFSPLNRIAATKLTARAGDIAIAALIARAYMIFRSVRV